MAASASTAHRTRVLVLYGGQSSEHPVSCVTAAGVLRAIDTEQFEVIPVGITRAGQWTIPAVDPLDHSFDGGAAPEVQPTDSTVVLHRRFPGEAGSWPELLQITGDDATPLGPVDVVLPLLHGPFGEDGTLQGFLEVVGVPYVGAGVLSSAVSMDKHFMKLAFDAAGLRVGPYQVITPEQWRRDPQRCLDALSAMTFPLFVKPARGGSSVGITCVDAPEELPEAIAEARSHDPKLVVEEAIPGREVECAVLGSLNGDAPRASLVGEIVVDEASKEHQFYDFHAKYTDGDAAELWCPAELPPQVSDEIRRQAVRAFEAVSGEGITRADFFWNPDAPTVEDSVVINEVNTMPGFTPISMYPKLWEATGIGYTELITDLLHLALERPLGLR
ncbi:D-alanine--D-alanine ligase family protein [Nesterenkonia sp. PF2B19]|uniref:D-alanine--D-alanine ligase family protein n=1 Tax=Nesterenkonia sp. PF2B19 TaxID=1881858 RepID=UPI000871FDC6|nr:D-alanine--D-alanine ligase family protein [Nesterenkonia sp. PF2B19]OSM42641.1 D-alanine--D-alanine ligase A [Nesterenkonia sp. PF2B19]